MANIWDAIKNAGTAWQETQKNMYYAPNTVVPTAPKPQQNTSGGWNVRGGNGSSAMGYAADAASKIGDVTITEQPAKGNVGGSVTTVPSLYDQYARAVDRQNNLLKEQQELMRRQREAQMNATIRANNQAADKSLKEAYVANMMSKRNLPQQLKALGVSGGRSETTLADIDNTYMNNRFGIEANRNDANLQARMAYDNGVNGDYSDYLAKAYELQGGFADAIASGKLAGSKTVTKSASTPGRTVKGYKIDSLGITGTDEVDLYSKMMASGIPQEVAEQYLLQQGIIKPSSTGTPKR